MCNIATILSLYEVMTRKLVDIENYEVQQHYYMCNHGNSTTLVIVCFRSLYRKILEIVVAMVT